MRMCAYGGCMCVVCVWWVYVWRSSDSPGSGQNRLIDNFTSKKIGDVAQDRL